MKRNGTPRASARYWIDVAVKALSEHGPDDLTIDALCRKTKKTKGSFYAHFESHDAFLAALVAYWRESNTQAVTRVVEDGASPRDRLALLNHVAVRLDVKFDQGMRKLADRNRSVSNAVAKVDEMRIAYLASLYQSTEDYSEREAADLATVEYAAYVGLQQINPNLEPDELERLYDAFAKLVLRSPRT